MSQLIKLSEWRKTRFKTPPSASAARRWCENGDIPAKKLGAHWFVDIDKEVAQDINPDADELVQRVLGRVLQI